MTKFEVRSVSLGLQKSMFLVAAKLDCTTGPGICSCRAVQKQSKGGSFDFSIFSRLLVGIKCVSVVTLTAMYLIG
jgi:hypothetical protein